MGISLKHLPPAMREQAKRKLKAEPDGGEGFDSALERDYYYGEVYPRLKSGEILSCQMHKTFLLLPKAEYCGITLHKAEYTPDFYLEYADGRVCVVEVKSKAVRKLQQSYVYRRRLFIDLIARPNGWEFREIIQ